MYSWPVADVESRSLHTFPAPVNDYTNHQLCISSGCTARVCSVDVTGVGNHELMNQVENVKAGPTSLCCGSAAEHCQHRVAN